MTTDGAESPELADPGEFTVGWVESVEVHAAPVERPEPDGWINLPAVVDGASLLIRCGVDLNPVLTVSIARSVGRHDLIPADPGDWVRADAADPADSDHAAGPTDSTDSVRARLDVWGAGPIFLRSSEADRFDASVPAAVSLLDHALFEIGNWVHAATLYFGNPDCVRVHAAAVVVDGETWVIAGDRQSGKTTLAALEVAAGSAYLTDERVTVHRDDPVRVSALTRPIRLRDDGPANEVAPVGGPGLRDDLFCRLWYPDEMAGGVATSPAPAGHLIVLDEQPELFPTRTPGWVVRRLVELSTNVIRLGPAGLHDLARLVAASQVHVSPVRTLNRVGEAPAPIEPPVGGIADRLPTVPAGTDLGAGRRLTLDVDAVLIGAETLLWVPGERPRIGHLVGPGTLWWLDLAEGGTPADGAEEMLNLLTELGAC